MASTWIKDAGEGHLATVQILGHQLYPFIISGIVPRPIALLSSLSKEVRLP